jgi:hypothetical protein
LQKVDTKDKRAAQELFLRPGLKHNFAPPVNPMQISKKIALLFCALGIGVGAVSAITFQGQAPQIGKGDKQAWKDALFE